MSLSHVFGQLINNNNDHRQCRYLSPHSFKLFNRKLSNSEVQSSFSVFHNNVVSINQNLENLTSLLDELDFQFNLIGVTETKITNSNENGSFSCIPGYVFDFVPTALASGGVGLFIHESLNYTVLEKISDEAFQALWIEISFANNKNIVCGIIYRQHNSPDQFMSYFEETIEKLKNLLIKMYLSWAIST